MEAQVFKQDDAAWGKFGAGGVFDGFANAVIEEGDWAIELLAQLLGDWGQAVFFIALTIWAAEVRHQDDAGAIVEGVLNGWQSGDDTGRVGDHAVFQGHVEVNAHKTRLPARSTVSMLSLAMNGSFKSFKIVRQMCYGVPRQGCAGRAFG